MAEPFSELLERLELSDDEALAIFSLDALDAISGTLEHRPEIAILDTITAEAQEAIGAAPLARWLRAGSPGQRPLDLLAAGDFARFEDALTRRVDEAAG